MTTWKYAVSKESTDWYGIREVYINDDGSINAWTKDAMPVVGNAPAEIAETLQKMAACVGQPILDMTVTPVAFIEPADDHPRWLNDEPPGED